MKVVVIGGSGLIGSNLVGMLREKGVEVIAASPSTGVNAVTGEPLLPHVIGSRPEHRLRAGEIEQAHVGERNEQKRIIWLLRPWHDFRVICHLRQILSLLICIVNKMDHDELVVMS